MRLPLATTVGPHATPEVSGKYVIIDRQTLYMLSFNFTHLDIDRTRGFGIVTKNTKLVQEAINLFEADSTRRQYTPKLDTFVVSPANSRKVLGTFLKRAKKQLLIFDPKISDKEMIGILRNRAKAGVDVRVIGRVAARSEFAVENARGCQTSRAMTILPRGGRPAF